MDRTWAAAGAAAGDATIQQIREEALRFQVPTEARSLYWCASIAATAILACGLWWWGGKHPEVGRAGWSAEGAVHEVTMIDNVTHGQYATPIGERSTIRLADGSVVTLDTASRVSLDLTTANREVHLLGEGRRILRLPKIKLDLLWSMRGTVESPPLAPRLTCGSISEECA